MQAEMSRLRVVAPDTLPAAVVREPIVDGDAPSPGGYIREQRQRHGMSLEQLAAATKIPASSLRHLEADEFDALPGPVFVKGFLRCCTRALGLSSETVMELLYERERAALVARRQPPAAPATPATPSPAATDEAEAEAEREPPVAVAGEPPPAAESSRTLARLWARVSGTQALLWLVVAAFVAVLVMAAFDLIGSGPILPNT